MVVLDNGVLMRLLILTHALGVPENDVLPKALEAGKIQVLLAPPTADEFWRNVSKVYLETHEAWKKHLRETVRLAESLRKELNKLEKLQLCDEEILDDAKVVKQELSEIEPHEPNWSEFEEYASTLLDSIATKQVDLLPFLSDDDLLKRALKREQLNNPPTCKGKPHSLGDCMLWEFVLALLKAGHLVWFSTRDGDFVDPNDPKQVNLFLRREIADLPGSLKFFFENPKSDPPKLSILDELEKLLPKEKATFDAVKDGYEATPTGELMSFDPSLWEPVPLAQMTTFDRMLAVMRLTQERLKATEEAGGTQWLLPPGTTAQHLATLGPDGKWLRVQEQEEEQEEET